MALDIGRRQLARAVRTARLEGRALPRVVIVGGGLSGLGAAIQLTRAGLRDFTVVEQSEGVGGTWRDNTYPGSGCDVPSHLYSFSFATTTEWSRRFAAQPEILTYAEQLVDRFGLRPHLRLGTTVTRVTRDEALDRWLVSVTSPAGETTLEADTVVFACGQLNRPHQPVLAGIEAFAGPAFHSARWDHSVDLAGKRVAVVGSGASAIQFVPPVAVEAGQLTVYQRSPNYVGPKKDRRYRQLTRRLLGRLSPVARAYRWWIYWSLEFRWLLFRRDSWAGGKLQNLFRTELRNDVVSDRLPDAAVVPDYPIGCKRILISNDWYPTLLRPDVEVVDEPIDHLEPDAVVTADGGRRPADVLIFGTGFSTTDFLAHIPVLGEGGVTLADTWKDGARAYLGSAVPGFPNCYVLYGPEHQPRPQLDPLHGGAAAQSGAPSRGRPDGRRRLDPRSPGGGDPGGLPARRCPDPADDGRNGLGGQPATAGTRPPRAGSPTTGPPGPSASGTTPSDSGRPSWASWPLPGRRPSDAARPGAPPQTAVEVPGR